MTTPTPDPQIEAWQQEAGRALSEVNVLLTGILCVTALSNHKSDRGCLVDAHNSAKIAIERLNVLRAIIASHAPATTAEGEKRACPHCRVPFIGQSGILTCHNPMCPSHSPILDPQPAPPEQVEATGIIMKNMPANDADIPSDKEMKRLTFKPSAPDLTARVEELKALMVETEKYGLDHVVVSRIIMRELIEDWERRVLQYEKAEENCAVLYEELRKSLVHYQRPDKVITQSVCHGCGGIGEGNSQPIHHEHCVLFGGNPGQSRANGWLQRIASQRQRIEELERENEERAIGEEAYHNALLLIRNTFDEKIIPFGQSEPPVEPGDFTVSDIIHAIRLMQAEIEALREKGTKDEKPKP